MTHALSSPLSTAEAVQLAHALAAFVAHSSGIRVVFIKGPSFSHHQLRADRVSSDADLLVDPLQFDQLVGAMQDRGWREREMSLGSSRFITHSVTLVHPDWPCDLDVHRRYPGFLAPPATVFEEIWRDRDYLSYGGYECGIANHAGSAVILALHSLRITEHSRHKSELEGLTKRAETFSPEQRRAVQAFAQATGAVATLGVALDRIGYSTTAEKWELEDPAYTEWLDGSTSGAIGTHFWVQGILSAPWREKPLLIARAVWPTRRDADLNSPGVGRTWATLNSYRLRRLLKGLTSVPRVIVRRTTNRRKSHRE